MKTRYGLSSLNVQKIPCFNWESDFCQSPDSGRGPLLSLNSFRTCVRVTLFPVNTELPQHHWVPGQHHQSQKTCQESGAGRWSSVLLASVLHTPSAASVGCNSPPRLRVRAHYLQDRMEASGTTTYLKTLRFLLFDFRCGVETLDLHISM